MPIYLSIDHHHQSLVQPCWGRLYEICFAIPVYEPNPWINCTVSDITLLLPFVSSLAYPFTWQPINLNRKTCIEVCIYVLNMDVNKHTM